MSELKTPTKEQIEQYLDLYSAINEQAESLTEDELYEIVLQKEEFEEEFDTSCVVFEENGKRGLKDFTGRVVIPAEYDDIAWMCDYDILETFPMAVVKDSKMALVSTDGNATLLTGFDYDHLDPGCGLVITEVGGKVGCLNEDCEMIIEPVMDEIDIIDDFTVRFSKDGKMGFIISFDMEPVKTGLEFDEYKMDEDDILNVLKDGKWGYIASDGTFTEDKDNAFENNMFTQVSQVLNGTVTRTGEAG